MNRQAEAFQKAICSVAHSGIKGFIIDLRLNGGGSMYPMISGVSSLLGDGVIGGHQNPASGEHVLYTIEKGNLIVRGELSTNLNFVCKNIPADLPVAILISPFTGSSGEMTAMAFKGRKNTKFFGEKSAGFTTTTKGFYFGRSGGVVLSTDVMIDRNGKTYLTGIEPDEVVNAGDNFSDLLHDAKIVAAIKWLKNFEHRNAQQ